MPEREPGAIYASDLYGPTGQYGTEGQLDAPTIDLPPALVDYVNEHLRVCPVQLDEGRARILVNQELKPTRSIAVQFDDWIRPKVFCLGDMRPGKATRDYVNFQTIFPLGESRDKVDGDTFRHWVVGVCRSYVLERLNQLQRDLYLSSLAGAHFLTPVPSSKDLSGSSLSSDSGQQPVIRTLLELELPYLNGVSLEELAKARTNEAAFEEFRVALDKAFAQANSLEGGERQRRIDEIARDLIHAPLARIDARLRALNRNVFIDATLALGGLLSTILSGGNTLLGVVSLAAAMKTIESYKKRQDEQDKHRQDPSFFFWEATKGARERLGKGD